MRITWIGHSCFRLESGGYSLVIDPYEDGSVDGLGNVREEASAVLCTHGHGDHSFRDGVEIVRTSAAPFSVETIHSFHDDKEGSLRGRNEIYIISDGSAKVAHLGDLGCYPPDCDKLRNLDVLLIPVGGFFTIDGATAAAIVKDLQPRIAIPMHYRSVEKGFGFDVLSTADGFLSFFDEVKKLDGSSIDTSDNLKGIVVLNPRNEISTAYKVRGICARCL